jgi:hypothetical protein
MIVKLGDTDILYWREVNLAWSSSDNHASKYPNRKEAEDRAFQLAVKYPALLGKLQVKNFYENGIDSGSQGNLF